MAGNPTNKNLIAVVVGAVLLFGAISVIPIVIMRRHRRRSAERHANELRCLEANGTMRQVSVQRWLDQQTNSDDNLEQYVHESCPICLSSLLTPSALSLPGSTTQNHNHNQNQNPTLPLPPEAAHISHPDQCATTTANDHRTQPPRNPEGANPNTNDSVLIINRCKHAFHTGCLTSWFEYREYI